MPTVFLSPIPAPGSPLFIPGGNAPVSGGLLFQYATGTSNKLNTYTTSSGAVANANPIVLDSGGNLTGSREVWLIQSSTYRFVLAPSNDQDPPLSPYWTLDSISGVNDVATQLNSVGAEWIAASTTPVFSNASTFVMSGDQTSLFTVGRRVKTTNSGGTIYGTVTSAVFVSSTTVFAVPDSGGFDSGLSAVSYALLSTPDGSVPWENNATTGKTINGTTTIASLTAQGGQITTGPLTVNSTSVFNGLVSTQIASTSYANYLGKAFVSTGAIASSTAPATAIIPYTLAANALSATGQGVRFTFRGTTANNANVKTYQLVFGATGVLTGSFTPSQQGLWKVEGEAFRIASSSQRVTATLIEGTTTFSSGPRFFGSAVGASENDASTIALQMNITASTATGDVVQNIALIEYFK